MAVESEASEYDSIFALMAKSDDDEDNDDDEKKLISLANVLIDAYHNLINNKNALTMDLGEVENERDDMVIVVADLKETIEDLMKEKNVLIEKVEDVENERDDLLIVVMDIKETIEELKRGNSFGIIQKENEVASEAYIKLENELKYLKSSLCTELKRNIQLQEDLGRVKNDLEKSLKWTWSSDTITAIYASKGGNRQGVGFQKEKIPYWLCTHCGNIGHFKENCKDRFQYQQKNKEAVKGSSQKWYMDSGCSKHMTGSIDDFLSLKDLQGGSVSFGNDKKGYILGKIGSCSFTLLNKLIKKDLVRRLPKSSFKDHKVCDACVKGKKARSSFKPGPPSSLCGPIRVPSRRGKKYIFVIVDDYSRFTWTLFLRTKDETFPVFSTFVKKIQVKMSHNVVCIRSDHGTEFDNTKFDELCAENGISHNFSAPRSPQQNGVVERKNRTFEDMARTMLIDSGVVKYFWVEAVNTACYLVNMCMIRSLLNKTSYELLNGRKPKLTHLRTFGCKCFVLNNGKEALGKFDAKSDEGIFLGYSSQSKAYKVYNKRTQCVEERIHVIFNESHHLCGKDSHDKIDQDR
ncbi:uncharacterized protein [Nicotiana tomentosiformis]|uniref:uncharacterized protein n=1 Tax=Nicotiana tomentosiformis TaxID=4098 RepID=UPI00388C7614